MFGGNELSGFLGEQSLPNFATAYGGNRSGSTHRDLFIKLRP